jgi:SAM-dependent methyltransferase
MIDINNTLDLIKLKFFNEWLYTAHMYDEGEAPFHQNLTKTVVENYIDPLNLPKDALIMDMGCGPGYFLDLMKERGYTNLIGVTLSEVDTKICRDKGHNIKQYDMSFIPQKDGFHDESVDFIFCRHALEHSPYPVITLAEYNRLLKDKGKIYIEVPSPDCDRKHEYNLNHYSILGIKMWDALFTRTGFATDICNTLEFDIELPEDGVSVDGPKISMKEKFNIFMVHKRCPLDIK